MTVLLIIAAVLALSCFIHRFMSGSRREALISRLQRSGLIRRIRGVCGGPAEFLGRGPF